MSRFVVGLATIALGGALSFSLLGQSPSETPAPGSFETMQGPMFDTYKDLSRQLRCPTCTGMSVWESDAPFSNQIKAVVKEQVDLGKSEAEIIQYFTERYGPWILREPPREGFNMVAWIIPIAFLALGPPLIWLFIWRRPRKTIGGSVRDTEEILAEMNRRLEGMRAGG